MNRRSKSAPWIDSWEMPSAFHLRDPLLPNTNSQKAESLRNKELKKVPNKIKR